MTVLDEFEGFVDKIESEVAHVTLKAGDETYWAEIPMSHLNAAGILERRRFKLRIVEVDNNDVTMELESIPDIEIGEEEERRITEEIERLLGDEECTDDPV